MRSPCKTRCQRFRPDSEWSKDQCRVCWSVHHLPRWAKYRTGDEPPRPIRQSLHLDCVHRSSVKLRKIKPDGTTADTGCRCLPVYACAIHGECTLTPHCPTVRSCTSRGRANDCPDYIPRTGSR